jgi:hypothetical protein
MWIKRGLLIAVFISIAFAAFPPLTHATHSWGGYHWARTSNPFTLQLDDNVSTAWDAYLGTTSSDWSVSDVLDTNVVQGQANPKNCRAVSGRVEVCSASYGNTGWLGVAQIWISGLHIVQGTVKLNDTYFKTAKYNTPGWRNLVSCQEVGHTLGLDHQDTTFDNPNLGTCMDYTNDPDGTLANPDQLSNEHPNAHDYEELDTIYSHLDSTTTLKQSVSSNPAAANDDATQLGTAQWGKLIRSTNGGRTELFELDLGRGRKLFTRVIWADPEE